MPLFFFLLLLWFPGRNSRLKDHILHPEALLFEQVQPPLGVSHFESTQQARPQVAERLSDFRIQLPSTNFNDRLRQQIANIGGRLRCCTLLQSIRAIHRSSTTTLYCRVPWLCQAPRATHTAPCRQVPVPCIAYRPAFSSGIASLVLSVFAVPDR